MRPRLLLLTTEPDPERVLPALGLLPYPVRVCAPEPAALVSVDEHECVLVDARVGLAEAKSLCRLLAAGERPVATVVTEGGLVAVNVEWRVDEILLTEAGPAEVDARLRLLCAEQPVAAGSESVVRLGDLVIDEPTYTAKLRSRRLELTYKEFELLKYLAQHPGRVFTRVQLLQEVWGYDFLGGTRTVDVHIRRLRAKLGPEHEQLIGTVRNVGYKAEAPPGSRGGRKQVLA